MLAKNNKLGAFARVIVVLSAIYYSSANFAQFGFSQSPATNTAPNIPNYLICSDITHNSSNLKLLEGGIDYSDYYCDNVAPGIVHYVPEDQSMAKYTAEDIIKMRAQEGAGREYYQCPSKSAYRVINYKSAPDKNNKCYVTYDVYCDPNTFDTPPATSGKCPGISLTTIPESVEHDIWQNIIDTRYDWKKIYAEFGDGICRFRSESVGAGSCGGCAAAPRCYSPDCPNFGTKVFKGKVN